MGSRRYLVALALVAGTPALAHAVEFTYNGFGTAAYARTDTDDAVVGYSGQPEGIDEDGTFEIDSKLGLQLTATFNEMFSATLQGVAYADLTGDWEPRVDWAYLRWQPLKELSLRGGYLRAPTFMYSDSVFVGYANTWVRPPLEVYNQAAVYQLRGIDAVWRSQVGPVALSINPYYGDGEVELESGTLDAPEWMGLALTAEFGSFMTRVAYSSLELGTSTPALAPLIATLRSIPPAACPGCASEAERLDLDGPKAKFLTFGLQYDKGDNLVAAEFARNRVDGSYIVPAKKGGYVTYGRRFGSLMPYVTYAVLRRDEKTSSNAIPGVGPLAALRAAVNGIIANGVNDQDSYSIGARYELPTIAYLKGSLVKLQYDHIDAKDGPGMLNQVQPDFEGELDMISVSFDFIF